MTNGLKISIYASIIVICCLQFAFAQSDSVSIQTLSLDKKLHLGDEFTYIVKYAFLNLGEIKTIVYDKDTLDENIIYKSKGYIDSYEGLPFVSLHQVYESWFDTTFHPVYFKALIFNEEDTTYVKYNFGENYVHVLRGELNHTNTSMDTTVSLNARFQDGLSILYFARFISKLSNQIFIPCFVNEDTSTTIITYYDENEPVSIDAIDYDISGFRIEGNAGFTGIFGFTGYFEALFSNDIYSIPLYADVQVLIGDISIELMDWKKSNWQPPIYK